MGVCPDETFHELVRMSRGAERLSNSENALKRVLVLLWILPTTMLVYGCLQWSQKLSFRGNIQLEGPPRVLVSYSYFEKDVGQKENFEYFILAGIGVHKTAIKLPLATDFSIVVSGDRCTPCHAIDALVQKRIPQQGTMIALWEGHRLSIMHKANVGMDFAAHNATLEYMNKSGRLKAYQFFIFLNSSVRGPFFPSYMPKHWHWPDAFTDRLSPEVRIVSSSLVCLPAVDAGGFGPKVESWAFSVDMATLALLVEKGIFGIRSCKLCADGSGIVVGSEYGMSKVILDAGSNLATLMSRYARNTDWRDPNNWSCNNNVHPSRYGTYDGISMHPYESMFVKASWQVGEPYTSHYTRWARELDAGGPGTAGSFRESLYKFAISDEGQHPKIQAVDALPANGCRQCG